jgi:D-alanine-D-alanine ligase-like ATP-grasp enzyme
MKIETVLLPTQPLRRLDMARIEAGDGFAVRVIDVTDGSSVGIVSTHATHRGAAIVAGRLGRTSRYWRATPIRTSEISFAERHRIAEKS